MTEEPKRADPQRAESQPPADTQRTDAAPNRNRRRRRKPRQSPADTATDTATATSQGSADNAQNAERPRQRQPRAQGSSPSAQPGAAQSGMAGTSQPSRPRSPQHRNQRNRRGRSSPEIMPPVMAPPSRGRKRPLAEPRIAVGCIVLRGDEILLVRERGRWSLPKGGLEVGELVQDGARRETYEETGLIVEMRDLAFVVEFMAETWGHHLQFFYQAREIGGTLAPLDPDRDVQEAKFVPVRQLREYLRFRPRLVALETWLRERRTRHFVFNLDKEPAMLRKRRRVDMERVSRRRAMQAEQSEDAQEGAVDLDFDPGDELSAGDLG